MRNTWDSIKAGGAVGIRALSAGARSRGARPGQRVRSLSVLPPQSSSAAKARYAFDGIRAQIRDLHTENIANLALRARELGDVIALWYGEGDMVTPAFIRDAAKTALDDGLTFYIPNMRGYPPLNEALSEYQTRLHGQQIPIARTTVTPSGMQALYFALSLLVDVGTNVVYVAPQWPNIHSAIHLVGGEPRTFNLDFALQFVLVIPVARISWATAMWWPA